MSPSVPRYDFLADLLAEWLEGVPDRVRRATRTRRLFLPEPVFATEPLPNFACEFVEPLRCRATLALQHDARWRIAGTCTCPISRCGPCEHQVLLANFLESDLRKNGPQAKAWRAAVDVPDAWVFAELDRLLEREHRELPRDVSLVWIVEDHWGRLSFSLKHRAPLRSGKLSSARPTSARDFVDLLAQSACEHDRRLAQSLSHRFPSEGWHHVARTAGPQSTAWSDHFRDGIELADLLALAGHPNVYFGGLDRPLAIREASLALTVTESGDEVHVALTADGIPLPKGTHIFEDEGGCFVRESPDATLHVFRWPPDGERLASRLALGPLSVPRAHGAALVDRLARVEHLLPLDLPDSLRGTERAADERVRVVLEPVATGGAAVKLRLRPIAGGPLCVPGSGARLTALVEEHRTTCRRRPEAERTAAALLSRALGLSLSGEDFEALLQSDEELLDLMARLETPELDQVEVEWPAAKLQLVSNVRSRRVEVRAQADWFGLDGEIDVDGDELVLADLLLARREGRKYVPLGRGRFAHVAKLIDERLARLADLTHVAGKELTLSRGALAEADSLFADFEAVVPLSWTDLARRAREARALDAAVPAGLRAELREYQLEGYAWMRRLAALDCGGCLADDMGLGKTVQAIAMLLARAGEGPQFVLAPTSVGFNWLRELERFAPGLHALSLRVANRSALLSRVGPGDVVVGSYGLLRVEREALAATKWTTLVLDEAQAIKNWNTDTARAVRSLQADWKIALTGTPVENHLGELYSLMQTVLPGLFPSWEQFARSYAAPIEKRGDAARRHALAQLVRPFILRRTKAQVLTELPPRTEVRRDVVLPKAERALYEAARREAVASLSGEIDDQRGRFEVLAQLTRLRQIASCPHLCVPSHPVVSEKLTVLFDELEELLDEGRAALVFSQFATLVRLISAELDKRGVAHLVLTGETPAKERERLVTAFQNGEAKVFLVSLKAGGTGLNLTAADTVFLLDPWWNPAVEDQAADRAHRIGQTRAVTVVRLVAQGTIEEKVLGLHEKKRALVAGILEEADVAGKLSVRELIDLLRDGQRASEEDEDEATPRA